MGLFIDNFDLAPFATIPEAKAAAMVEDAEAMAILAAPCLPDLLTAPGGELPADAARRLAKVAALKAILRGAILRWFDAGSGAVQSQTAGPFGQTIDTRVQRKAMYQPSELEQLQGLCQSSEAGKAFAVDTVGASSYHQPWCSLSLGALYCSCGADLTGGYPLYEDD